MAKFYVVQFGDDLQREVYMGKAEAVKEARNSGYSFTIQMMEIPVNAESIRLILSGQPYAVDIKTVATG